MTSLSDIPVLAARGEPLPGESPVVSAVLNQVMELLAQFLASGTAAALDLKRVPRMDAATYRQLKDALSVGEVTATVKADVTVEITETQYPGVWWLTHRKEQGAIVTEVIEITDLPVILKSHAVDMRAGLQRLEQALAIAPRRADPQETA